MLQNVAKYRKLINNVVMRLWYNLHIQIQNYYIKGKILARKVLTLARGRGIIYFTDRNICSRFSIIYI